MTLSYTLHFKFGIPDFTTGPWHADWEALVRKIDEILYEVAVANNATVWTNSTAYIIGNIVISPQDGTMWIASVAHTSAASPTTFSADRLAHPTFWTSFGVGGDLTAIEALTGTGFPTRVADDVWALRTMSITGSGILISNGNGVAGNPVLSLDGDLQAISLLGTTGIPVRTAADTWALRLTVQPLAGITITNADGVLGNITFALANDLSALEALASSGFSARTGSDTWAIRTLQQPAAGITITNPAGTAGDPTFVLANDLGAIEALNSNALLARTGTDTWAARTITGPAAGITVSNGSGVGGNPTLALANDLSALEALASSGFSARTGTDTWAIRTLVAPAAGLTISNNDGVAGNPTFAFANDLAAIEALNTNGMLARTGTDTWAARTITGTGAEITVTNGDGVGGNPTLSLPTALTFTGKTVTDGTYVNDLHTGYSQYAEIASPANPAADNIRVFAKDVAGVTHLFTRNSAGGEVDMSAAGGASSSGSRVLLNTLTAAGSASLADTTSLTATYKRYEIVFEGLIHATAGGAFRFRVNQGGVQTTGYKGRNIRGTTSSVSTTEIPLQAGAVGETTEPGLSAVLYIDNPSASIKHMVYGNGGINSSSGGAGTAETLTFGGWFDTAGVVTGFEVTSSVGNITSGVIKVFGIVN